MTTCRQQFSKDLQFLSEYFYEKVMSHREMFSPLKCESPLQSASSKENTSIIW